MSASGPGFGDDGFAIIVTKYGVDIIGGREPSPERDDDASDDRPALPTLGTQSVGSYTSGSENSARHLDGDD